jgi:hypothetical protein
MNYTLFQSYEYASCGRSDADFVGDLYRAWLQREPNPDGLNFWLGQMQSNGRDFVLNAFATSGEFQILVTGLCDALTYDADGDGLPDAFENQLADAFAPDYHVSAGEPDHFATFNDLSASQTIQRVFGATPPINYFRVTPLGFRTSSTSGTQLAFSLGLVGISSDVLLPIITSHNLDNERSAILVAAPTQGYNVYNTDPQAYKVYEYYTAAHENTFWDQSLDLYLVPAQPAPTHLPLWLSRSKHATYPGNPDFTHLHLSMSLPQLSQR